MSILQSFQKCCPNLVMTLIRKTLIKLNKTIHHKQKKQSAGIHHLEEEEFQFAPNSKFGTEEDKQTHPNLEDHQIISHDQTYQPRLEVKIQLNSMNQPSQIKKESEKKEQQIFKDSLAFDFKVNLEPFDEYYEVIQNRTSNIQQYFSQKSKAILIRGDKSTVSIKQIQSLTGFKLLISYKLPCSYAFFSQISQNHQLTTQLSPIIASSQTVEVIHPNLTLNQINFKKFMLLEPRYFNYLKYINTSGPNHWQVCISLKSRPNIDVSFKQCELFSLSCCYESKQHLIFSNYLEVDLKSNIRAQKVVLRVCEEIANYFDNLWNYTRQNYSEVQA